MIKKCLTTALLFLSGLTVAQAATVTIDQIPAEFARLQATYQKETKNITTAQSLTNFKQEYAKAKEAAKKSPGYLRKHKILEDSRARDMKVIQDRYEAGLAKLNQETMSRIDKKYQKNLAVLQSRTSKRLRMNYIADLKILEKKLIAQQNLAGALLVQNERKAIENGAPTPATVQGNRSGAAAKKAEKKPARKRATQRVVKKPQSVPVKKAAAIKPLSAENPQIYRSTNKGLAGAGQKNIRNNVYTFKVDRYGTSSQLSFRGWGIKTTDTKGQVYLTGPDGSRTKVAGWSAQNLKKNTFYEVKKGTDIDPIEADISKLVKKAGEYQVEFVYQDGLEAFVIYEVAISTW